MKRIILVILAILLFAFNVEASPFITCDPYIVTETQPTVFEVVMDGGAKVDSLPVGAMLKFDVGSVSVGSHSVSIKACTDNTAEGWGRLCSSAVPFVFTRPSTPSIPRNIKLIP